MKNTITRVLEQSYGPFPEEQLERMGNHIFKTITKESAGWVPLDHTGEVYRSEISNAYSGGRGSTRKNVRKLYDTEKRAASYSPVKLAKEVFFL